MTVKNLFSAALFSLALVAEHAIAQEAVSLLRQDQKTVQGVVYQPSGAVCRGIALISHGAGGSEKGYRYLGQAMSDGGYLAIVVAHQESGRTALLEHRRGGDLSSGLLALLTDQNAYRGRLMDIAAVKEWAANQCSSKKSILIGHSMGAATVMVEAGARNKLGLHGTASFDAYIALSPQGVGFIFPANAWVDMKKPVLSITGTRDGEIGGKSWETRQDPYFNMSAGCKWLAVIHDATHMHFAGNGLSASTEKLTTQIIALFLDGVERRDCKAPYLGQGVDLQSK